MCHNLLCYVCSVEDLEVRNVWIWLELGQPLKIWLSVSVRPPSFNQVLVARC